MPPDQPNPRVLTEEELARAGLRYAPGPEDDLASAYANMLRGGQPPDRQMGLMGRLPQPTPGAPPVPRGTTDWPEQGPLMPGASIGPIPTSVYGSAMGAPEPMGPPQPAERVPERGDQGSQYHQIVDQYLQSLTQPVRLPEATPYSHREKLAMLAAREPWQREVIVSQHREPYERAMAEAQINERRRSSAAGVASDLEKARQYERSRRPSQELDYVDKVEKAQADVGNADYPYTRPQWKALAQFKAQTAAGKLPQTKEAAIAAIDDEIRADEGRFLQATSDPLRGFMPESELEGGRRSIVSEIQTRRAALQKRQRAIAGMTPDIYRKFRNLTAEQQEEAIKAFERRNAGPQNESGQPGPVEQQPSYYP